MAGGVCAEAARTWETQCVPHKQFIIITPPLLTRTKRGTHFRKHIINYGKLFVHFKVHLAQWPASALIQLRPLIGRFLICNFWEVFALRSLQYTQLFQILWIIHNNVFSPDKKDNISSYLVNSLFDNRTPLYKGHNLTIYKTNMADG